MTETQHPNGVRAVSNRDDDWVVIHQHLGSGTIRLPKDTLVAIALEHCVIATDHPRIGQSIYRSADAAILEARAAQEKAEQAVRALEATHLLTGDDEALLTDGLLTMEAAINLHDTMGLNQGRTDPAGRDAPRRLHAIHALLRKRGVR